MESMTILLPAPVSPESTVKKSALIELDVCAFDDRYVFNVE